MWRITYECKHPRDHYYKAQAVVDKDPEKKPPRPIVCRFCNRKIAVSAVEKIGETTYNKPVRQKKPKIEFGRQLDLF